MTSLEESALGDFRRIMETIGSGARGEATKRNWPEHIMPAFGTLGQQMAKVETKERGMARHVMERLAFQRRKLERLAGKRNLQRCRARTERRIVELERVVEAREASADACHMVVALEQGRLDLLSLDPDDRADMQDALNQLASRLGSIRTNLDFQGYKTTKATEDAIAKSQSQVAQLLSRLEV